jgi:two-component system chemotaxis sensor kinase CheA
VRDASTQLGKRIRLVLEGEETELDRTVVEEIGDPLVHMIRNAIDHGIEGPDGRLAAGKEPEGTVTLRAYHRGGHVVIEIADDGRGLDPARIRARAVQRGLVAPDAVLDDRAVFDLIFAPGFSTAETVTDLSGRGVGMDVARRNIERIRGTIRIESELGRGTTFTVAIPLTLAIIEGLLVAVGDQRYVIPTLAVCESFRPAVGAVSQVHGRGEVVSVRGRLVPVMRLARHFGVRDAVSEPTEGILVAVEAGNEMRCLLVDALVGKQEVVIKSLGETFAGRSGFAGAAILGDGRVGLILDPASLVRRRPQSTETAA